MSTTDLIALAAVFLSVYGIYLAKLGTRKADAVQRAQRVGHALLTIVNSQLHMMTIRDAIERMIESEVATESDKNELRLALANTDKSVADLDEASQIMKSDNDFPLETIEEVVSRSRIIERRAEYLIEKNKVWEMPNNSLQARRP